jgi:hypothetical protein
VNDQKKIIRMKTPWASDFQAIQSEIYTPFEVRARFTSKEAVTFIRSTDDATTSPDRTDLFQDMFIMIDRGSGAFYFASRYVDKAGSIIPSENSGLVAQDLVRRAMGGGRPQSMQRSGKCRKLSAIF